MVKIVSECRKKLVECAKPNEKYELQTNEIYIYINSCKPE